MRSIGQLVMARSFGFVGQLVRAIFFLTGLKRFSVEFVGQLVMARSFALKRICT